MDQAYGGSSAGDLAARADSWYMGVNIPSKHRQLLFHPWAHNYMDDCEECARNGYSGFELG